MFKYLDNIYNSKDERLGLEEFVRSASKYATIDQKSQIDPSWNFKITRAVNYIMLTALAMHWFWMTTMATEITNSIHKLTLGLSTAWNLTAKVFLYMIIVFNFLTLALSIAWGLIANFTARLDWYHLQSRILIWNIVSNITVFYLDDNYFIDIRIQLCWYFFLRYLMSQIYNGVLLNLLQKVRDLEVRDKMIAEFEKLESSNDPDGVVKYFCSQYLKHRNI